MANLTARTLVLSLIICIAMSLADIFRYQICPGTPDKKPFTVIR